MPAATTAPVAQVMSASTIVRPSPWAGLRWRWNRLRCMSFAEMAHRAARLAQAHTERLLPAPAMPAIELSSRSRSWVSVPEGLQVDAYMAAARRAAAGRVEVFALGEVELGSPPRWNRDPRTGIEAPTGFGKLLDYRRPELVGDIKYLWEPNRHLQLVALAQAWALTGDAQWLQALRVQLESWFDACPHGCGPNWASALEPALRLINWSVCWQLAGGPDSPLFDGEDGRAFRHRWLEAVYRHAAFVRGFLSLHSSANNHLVGELSGLFIAAVTWPHWPVSGKWRDAARSMLEQEAGLQNAPDGVNREQAVSYQQWEIDLLLLPWLAGRANGVAFTPAYADRIESMMSFLASVMDEGGHVPQFGDSDDACVVKLHASGPQFCRYRSTLATGAVLFRRGDFKAVAGPLDDRTRWLLGPEGESIHAGLGDAVMRRPSRIAFPEGGYYVLGCDFGSGREIRLVADAGPLGYRSIAAHGHADALSFTLSVGGREFFIDPGTYAYHTQEAWRGWFRGTSAHNTVCIDGMDQSTQGGNFMWLTHARAQCLAWRSTAEVDELLASHDGYRRLADPLTHRRRITLDKQRRLILIEDILDTQGEHQAELLFHCHEDCIVESGLDEDPSGAATERTIVIRHSACGPHPATAITGGASAPAISLVLPALPGFALSLRRGSESPMGGWVSRRFDVKVPATEIVFSGRLHGATLIRSLIRCHG